jgi:hypothetical protein
MPTEKLDLDALERDYSPELNYKDNGDPRVLVLIARVRELEAKLADQTQSADIYRDGMFKAATRRDELTERLKEIRAKLPQGSEAKEQ